VIGTVSKATEETISLEMEGGTTRDFTIKDGTKAGMIPHPGDRILLEFDEGNRIIDIIDIGGKHPLILIHGELIGVDPKKKVITLKLKNGTPQIYKMKEEVADKMTRIEKGTAVTVMVDQHGYFIIDAHIA
jgi:hypothetical protein